MSRGKSVSSLINTITDELVIPDEELILDTALHHDPEVRRMFEMSCGLAANSVLKPGEFCLWCAKSIKKVKAARGVRTTSPSDYCPGQRCRKAHTRSFEKCGHWLHNEYTWGEFLETRSGERSAANSQTKNSSEWVSLRTYVNSKSPVEFARGEPRFAVHYGEVPGFSEQQNHDVPLNHAERRQKARFRPYIFTNADAVREFGTEFTPLNHLAKKERPPVWKSDWFKAALKPFEGRLKAEGYADKHGRERKNKNKQQVSGYSINELDALQNGISGEENNPTEERESWLLKVRDDAPSQLYETIESEVRAERAAELRDDVASVQAEWGIEPKSQTCEEIQAQLHVTSNPEERAALEDEMRSESNDPEFEAAALEGKALKKIVNTAVQEPVPTTSSIKTQKMHYPESYRVSPTHAHYVPCTKDKGASVTGSHDGCKTLTRVQLDEAVLRGEITLIPDKQKQDTSGLEHKQRLNTHYSKFEGRPKFTSHGYITEVVGFVGNVTCIGPHVLNTPISTSDLTLRHALRSFLRAAPAPRRVSRPDNDHVHNNPERYAAYKKAKLATPRWNGEEAKEKGVKVPAQLPSPSTEPRLRGYWRDLHHRTVKYSYGALQHGDDSFGTSSYCCLKECAETVLRGQFGQMEDSSKTHKLPTSARGMELFKGRNREGIKCWCLVGKTVRLRGTYATCFDTSPDRCIHGLTFGCCAACKDLMQSTDKSGPYIRPDCTNEQLAVWYPYSANSSSVLDLPERMYLRGVFRPLTYDHSEMLRVLKEEGRSNFWVAKAFDIYEHNNTFHLRYSVWAERRNSRAEGIRKQQSTRLCTKSESYPDKDSPAVSALAHAFLVKTLTDEERFTYKQRGVWDGERWASDWTKPQSAPPLRSNRPEAIYRHYVQWFAAAGYAGCFPAQLLTHGKPKEADGDFATIYPVNLLAYEREATGFEPNKPQQHPSKINQLPFWTPPKRWEDPIEDPRLPWQVCAPVNFCPLCTERVMHNMRVVRDTQGLYLPPEHDCRTIHHQFDDLVVCVNADVALTRLVIPPPDNRRLWWPNCGAQLPLL